MDRDEATAAVLRRLRAYRDAHNRCEVLMTDADEAAEDDAWEELLRARRELFDALDDLDEVEGAPQTSDREGRVSRTVAYTIEVDPEEMARRGRLGGARTAELHDGRTLTQPARDALNARFASEPDPEEARRAYYARLGRASGAARRARKEGR